MSDVVLGIGMVALIAFMIRMGSKQNKRAKGIQKECGYCGMQIPLTASICPYCRHRAGSDLKGEAKAYLPPVLGIVKWFVIISLIVLAVGFLDAYLGLGILDKLFG
jgi:Mn2+/Fe2+ NRAMP family transporter